MRHHNVSLAAGVYVLRGALSPRECAALIQESERVGYEEAPITTSAGPLMAPEVRNNTRVMVDDPARAAWLWDRLASHVPLERPGWEPAGLNERLRYYRYDVGQRFNWHIDGAFVRDARERSFLTLMIYLNEDFDGGETSFVLPPGAEGGARVADVVPETGMALVFPHPLRHTGAVVKRGVKYVLRTDVMGRRAG